MMIWFRIETLECVTSLLLEERMHLHGPWIDLMMWFDTSSGVGDWDGTCNFEVEHNLIRPVDTDLFFID
jgi:hypothetical protein